MIVVYRRLARDDLAVAMDFYEKQADGLGDKFLDSILFEAASLSKIAGVHRKTHGHFRMIARTFPFAIYYQIKENRIEITRILDCRRDPRRIRRALFEH